MNGSDIRVLAERAAALEDRSTERVAEVHERISQVRHQRRAAAVAGIVTAAVLLAVTAFVVAPGGEDEAPVPAPEPASIAAPERGDCWAVPAGRTTDQDYWYDDSPQVPCTEEHTTETVLSYPLDEPTPDAAEAFLDRCGEAVRNYLGVDQESWIAWGWVALLPSEQQVEDGASWMRCDAVFPTWFDFGDARTLTAPVLGAADERPDDFWVCLDQSVTVLHQPLVPCNRPHAYEQTGTIAFIAGSAEYPAEAVLDEEAQTQCGRAVPKHLAGAAVVAVWDRARDFDPYVDVVGVCFMFDPTGQPLPAR